MKKIIFAIFVSFLTTIVISPFSIQASGDLTKQAPIELRIQLGDEKDSLVFVPKTFQLKTGNLYRLLLVNTSPQKHYFSSDEMSRAVFTRKVQINGSDGNPIAEVKGTIREIEVYPQGTAEWWFVPVKAGTFTDLKCTISGHAERGMVGTVVIK